MSQSRRTLTFLCLIIILLAILDQTGAGHSEEKSSEVEAKTCAVCDSLLSPNCTNDETLQPGFVHNCSKPKTWCYKSEGIITTYNELAEKVQKSKVDRGCAKPYFKQSCVHVKQEDGTDFKVCFCEGSLCNWNYSVGDQKMFSQSSVNSGSRLWGMTWLIYLSVAASPIVLKLQ